MARTLQEAKKTYSEIFVYLFLVIASPVSPAFTDTEPWPATIELSSLAEGQELVFHGVLPYELTGHTSASADINADGYDDVLIAAWGASVGETGALYVYYGSSSHEEYEIDLSTLD